MSILTVSALRKVYSTRFGSSQVEALKNVNFSVEEGEFVAIMGESGSGKTTLLNIIAALDKPTSGSVLLAGRELSEIKDAELSNFRRDNLGFVFQEFNLLDTFTVEDNIYLPLVLAGKKYPEMHRALLPLAEQLGIKELLKKYRSCLNAAPRLPEVLAREMGDQLYIASFEDEAAMQAFHAETVKPTCIIMDTTKGKGVSYMTNSVDWHGKGPNDDEYKIAIEELNAAYAALEQEEN